jgi:NAD(P)H dehydrogenase (quinone)
MIVVTGVTGRLGRVVIEDLLTRVPADQLVAVARRPEKAADLAERGVTVRHGDYEDREGLSDAFVGADRLLFVSSSDVTPGVRRRHTRTSSTPRSAMRSRSSRTPARSRPTRASDFGRRATGIREAVRAVLGS